MAKKKAKKNRTNAAPVQQQAPSEEKSVLFNAAGVVKICRLCESKNGPFMNVFGDPELGLAKKVEDLLPFVIKENDELPHRVCFRCTAKLEELHEFVQKCITSQDNLEKMFGKENTLELKPKPAKRKWEETTIKSQQLKSELCDTIIKKAMERMKVLRPTLQLDVENCVPLSAQTSTQNGSLPSQNNKNNDKIEIIDDSNDMGLIEKQYKTRSGVQIKSTPTIPPPITPAITSTITPIKTPLVKEPKNLNISHINKTETKLSDITLKKSEIQAKEPAKTTEFKVNEEKNSFDIMDHVTIIKVNGVGTLFQCKICNRNFLSRESVVLHGCAKNGLKVHYANTKTNTDQNNSQNVINTVAKPKPGPARFKQKADTPNSSSIVKLHSGPNDTYSLNPSSSSGTLTIKKVVNHSPVETQVSPAQSEPYPVGLFTTSRTMTPAMKKQSYQVLQTSNPNKLLISSKVEDAGSNSKKEFTFINVDPINQPSYVLPTDTVVQEPRISTSDKDPNKTYTCNICNLKFTREKKLLAHIQEHFNKLDNETNDGFKRKTRKK